MNNQADIDKERKEGKEGKEGEEEGLVKNERI